MKILWVSEHPEAPTGFGNITHFICKGLAKEGCDVHIVCWGVTNQTRRWQGCIVHTVNTYYHDHGANAVLNLLPQLRPDYLVTVGNPRLFIRFAKLGGEHEVHRYGVRWILYYPLDGELEDGSIPSDWRNLIELCDIPVAASHYTQELSRRCNIEVEMIPHGVSSNIFIPPTDKEAAKGYHGYGGKFVILSDARNQPRKMLPRLLEIFAEFSRTRPDSLLHLHCDPTDPYSGTEPNRLQSLIDEMGIREQTRFTKNFRFDKGLHIEDLAKLYQAADVHLLISGGEGFGLPTLQAAASAVVPFAPNYSSNPELIEDHGELIKVQTFMRGPFGMMRAIVDIEDAVERLTRYYNERSLLVTVGARARIAALSYDWSLIIPMWLRILKYYKNDKNITKLHNVRFSNTLSTSGGSLSIMEDSANPAFEKKNEPESSINLSVDSTPRLEDPSPSTLPAKPCGCGSMDNHNPDRTVSSPSYIYAIGKVVHRFPKRSLEMELAQATGRRVGEETRGLTHEEVVYKALTEASNRYIARQICYVLNIEGLETYILIPNDPLDIDRLAEALRPAPDVGDIDAIIGRRGPIAPPEMCNGLVVPIVVVDQIYSFDRDTLMKAIPKRKEKGTSEDQFRKTTNALFNHIIQIADNAGAIDEHRAINYLSVRYDEIYHRTQLMQDENYSFSAVDVRPSRLSGARKIVDVICSYENRASRAIQRWFVRVDVTEEFPFLVSPMQEYFER
jgi:glycosyltransferase involved in cell wall biosynthesis